MNTLESLTLALVCFVGTAQAQSPPARYWHSMASNGATTEQASRIYVFGGNEGAPNTAYLNDLWYYEVAAGGWTQLTPVGRKWPKLGRGHNALSCGGGKCVVFGGTSGTKALNETWYFTEPAEGAVQWTQVSCRKASSCPPARYLSLMAYDPTRGYHVHFGGARNWIAIADTYTFDGTGWTARPSASTPPARAQGSVAFVPTHVSNGAPVAMDKVVIFGGDPYPNDPYPEALCDMHAWNGATWERIVATNQGPCLVGATMAWDVPSEGNPRLSVAGGYVRADGIPNFDTWYFAFRDSTSGTWARAPDATCAPLDGALGAYDVPSGQLVFFGGSDGHGTAYDDLLVCP